MMTQDATPQATKLSVHQSIHGRFFRRAAFMACLCALALQLGCSAGPSDRSVDQDAGSAATDGTLRVMTFNVLCSFCVFPEFDPWAKRLPHLQSIISEHDPDLIGLQELTFAWDDKDEPGDMVSPNPDEYATVFYVSPKGEGALPAYPDATIYYRKNRFSLVNKGFFWLSPKPEEPFSSGFAKNGSLPRIVAWVVLTDTQRPGKEVLFVNTHFDNNTPSQEMSAPLLLSQLADFAKASAAPRDIIVVGDFNAAPGSPAYTKLEAGLSNSADLATKIERMEASPGQEAWQVSEAIDHIFVSKGANGKLPEVRRWVVDLRRFGDKDRFPSDHFPVVADLLPN
ncbi:MAG: endonuclease/exonuclease/phosphatase family protein [Myxococcales bacterium]|nr:endonuclease/exonuclease/phosphatase family protein [Myxococcales bacterium]